MISIKLLEYFKLYEDLHGLCSYGERVVRKIVNALERAYCKGLDCTVLAQPRPACTEPVILSMTTFPDRIHYVHLAVRTLLNQSVKPEKVILWLAKEQFRDVELPKNLLELCPYGLDIRYCEEDILAHKKYYYAMRQFPNHIIVTYDDDILYPEDSLVKLLKMHQRHPHAIICNRGREICIENGKIAPYSDWRVSGNVPAGTETYRVMASTGAGTLYPPSCMPEETFDIDKIQKLALTADDLWMKVMSVLGGIPVVKSQTRCKGLCVSIARQDITLAHKNVWQKLNDRVIQDLLKFYPQIREKLLKDLDGQ